MIPFSFTSPALPHTSLGRLLLCIAAAMPVAGHATDPTSAHAAYPTRPIVLVLPLAPGGATDTLARALAQGVSAKLGQPVVIEHRPGGGGTIASAAVARAAPDGYTLLFANFATHATAPTLFKALSYDPVKDFKAISLVATSPHILLINATSPIRDVRQLIEAGRQPGRKLDFGSSGAGSPLHLAAEYFSGETGAKIVHIPFKSSGPALSELMAGRLDAMFDNLSSGLPLVQSGKLRALAITSATRSPLSPDTPTVQEQGVKNFNTYGWWGVLAPGKVPAPIISQLAKAIQQTLASGELQKTLTAQGFDPIGSSSGDFDLHISQEIAKWGTVIKSAGVSID